MSTRIRTRALVALALTGAAAAAEPIAIGERESIVIYGDSITEQNLYAAYLETYLISRLPTRALDIFNYGWSGDSAAGGATRFVRDCGGVHPTLVLVDFGMNDGGYRGPDAGIRDAYLAAQRRLAGVIAAAGAREVLETTSPIDPDKRADHDLYNDTLAAMADGVIALGAELQVPVIDQFHPLRTRQAAIKAEHPGFTMIPDSVHPDPIGHLAMAHQILLGFALPRGLGAIAVDGDRVTADGAVTVADAHRDGDHLDWTMTLPFIPFFVPDAARPGLALFPFERDLNAFVLSARDLKPTASYALLVDDVEAGLFTGEQLAAGVDLAMLDSAPWAKQGRALWDACQVRWGRHYDAWRHLGFEGGALAALPSFAAMRDAETAFVRDSDAALRAMVQPHPCRVTLVRQHRMVFPGLALSPLYPWDGDADKAFAPETDPDHVAWTPAALNNGVLDLLTVFPRAENCAVYARTTLHADAACTVHLEFGSDDGLRVFLDGKRILARDVMRALNPREDQLDVQLTPGDHTLLLRVTQGGGGFGVAVSGAVVGDGDVTAR